LTATTTLQSNKWQGMDFKMEETAVAILNVGMEEIGGYGTDVAPTKIALVCWNPERWVRT
jgi:hypothetical protein